LPIKQYNLCDPGVLSEAGGLKKFEPRRREGREGLWGIKKKDLSIKNMNRPGEIRYAKLNSRCCDFVNLTRQASSCWKFHGVNKDAKNVKSF
jgi:hypothetical protein